MPDTFNADPDTLPPLTKAIRNVWRKVSANDFNHPMAHGTSQFLDAIHALELRVIALEKDDG